MSEERELTMEERFAALDEILHQMESDGVALEESFALYEKGMRLLSETNERLAALEARVEEITAGGQVREFAAEG